MNLNITSPFFMQIIKYSLIGFAICLVITLLLSKLRLEKAALFFEAIGLIGLIPLGLWGLAVCVNLFFSFLGVFLNGAAFKDSKVMVSIMTIFFLVEGYQGLKWGVNRKDYSYGKASPILILFSILYLLYTCAFMYPIYLKQGNMLSISQFILIAVLLGVGVYTLIFQVKSRNNNSDDN